MAIIEPGCAYVSQLLVEYAILPLNLSGRIQISLSKWKLGVGNYFLETSYVGFLILVSPADYAPSIFASLLNGKKQNFWVTELSYHLKLCFLNFHWRSGLGISYLVPVEFFSASSFLHLSALSTHWVLFASDNKLSRLRY
jgi:hypothetical protein